MIDRRRQVHDAETEPNVLGALTRRRQEDLGAVEWQYSSRKWCSVNHTVEKPALSAASTSSRPSWKSLCSSSSLHGRGSGNS